MKYYTEECNNSILYWQYKALSLGVLDLACETRPRLSLSISSMCLLYSLSPQSTQPVHFILLALVPSLHSLSTSFS